MINKKEEYARIGDFKIQGEEFEGIPDSVGDEKCKKYGKYGPLWRGRMKYIAQETGLIYEEVDYFNRTGGHQYLLQSLKYPDGEVLFSVKRVIDCIGPGYSCSYPHGPFYKYLCKRSHTLSDFINPKEVELITAFSPYGFMSPSERERIKRGFGFEIRHLSLTSKNQKPHFDENGNLVVFEIEKGSGRSFHIAAKSVVEKLNHFVVVSHPKDENEKELHWFSFQDGSWKAVLSPQSLTLNDVR